MLVIIISAVGLYDSNYGLIFLPVKVYEYYCWRQILSQLYTLSSLGSRPPPFRARFNYA